MEQGRSREILRALYDYKLIRWKVLWSLMQSSKTVSELSEQLGVEQSAMSHHLQVLRASGLVQSSGRHKHRVYRLVHSTRIGNLLIDIQNLTK